MPNTLEAHPPAYKKATVFSDYWKAYQAVIPDEQHCPVGKETGATAYVKRGHNTLRQQVGQCEQHRNLGGVVIGTGMGTARLS